MNSEQIFWAGSGGDSYAIRVKEYQNTKYNNGYEKDIMRSFLSNIPRDSSVLELGCNIGNVIQILKEFGFSDITGVDINESAIRKARERFPEFNFIHSSIEDLDVGKTFDLVLTSGVLIHIPPDSLTDVIEKIQKLSNSYIFGREYYSKEFTKINYFSYCASGDYPSLFKIKPIRSETHQMIKKARAPNHIFYLIKK